MDIASLANSQPPVGGNDRTQQAFREADFLSIMLTELTNQDPFQPSETAKIVENMQKLQELANTNYEKFRGDLRWGQDLVGQPVTVSQSAVSADEAAILADRGINVDIGYGTVQGVVSGYRSVGETVWLAIDDKDYPIDNVQQITPAAADAGRIAGIADGFVGRQVRYWDPEAGSFKDGKVQSVAWDGSGQVLLQVDNEVVPFEAVRAIVGN